MRRLALVGLVLLCTCKKPSEGGLEVDVTFAGFTPGCLEVTLTDVANPANTGTSQVRVTANRLHTVASALGGWGRRWSVSIDAREASCSGKVVAHAEDTVEVPTGKPLVKAYELSAADSDGDGFVALASGGTDCNDAERLSAPGLPETCGDGIDNDCQRGADCADSSCAGRPCDDGDGCTVIDVCSGSSCVGVARDCGAAPVACRVDAGTCAAGVCSWENAPAAAPCGAGLACRQDGVCVPSNTELNCSDGIDDDNDDAGIDCADPDCNAAACDAGACVTSAVCGGGACVGAPRLCGPAPACRDAGVCDPAVGACVYPAAPAGSACSDGDGCSVGDACNGSGVCAAGPAMTCPGSGPCLTGGCDAGACVLTAVNGSCNDDAGCTHSDTCVGGACSGTAYTCASPPECMQSGACLGDGGCAFTGAVTGTPCPDAGFCVPGGCARFPYAVANVDPAAFAPGASVLLNCAVTFDTSDGGVTPGWCGGRAPAVTFTTQASGEPVVVLSMAALRIMPDAGSLKLVGSRPAVLLVWDPGTTLIEGPIDARGALDVAGAGGDRSTCGANGFGGAAQAGGTAASAGGGGAGGATRGGFGGSGFYMSGVTPGDGGLPGAAGAAPVVGGCAGGLGGRAATCTGCRGGSGGGGLQLSTAGRLRIVAPAFVSVSGGGGTGQPAATSGSHGCGGCGGGSGGVVLFEGAPLEVAAGAWVTANGGGGSGGTGSGIGAGPGQNGAAQSLVPAPGALGVVYGGFGGAGAAGSAPPGNGQAYMNPLLGNGGGGGGAVGFIWLRSRGACVRTAGFSPAAGNASGCP